MSKTQPNPDGGPAEPAIGFGPNAGGEFSQEDYHHPAAAWGAAISVGLVLLKQHELIDGARVVFKMNHENGGYDCPGCAWPDDRHGLTMDICENGIKHATWELTKKKTTPEFFAAHTVSELATWSDFALEDQGRLTEPMRYDAASDKYVPVSWEDAFALVGEHLRGLDSPNRAAFYTSGRLSNEATFLYQLWARELGTNNLPDCSNMCHEASGRAMTGGPRHRQGDVRPGRLAEDRLPDRHGRQRRLQRAPDADLAGRGVSPRGEHRPHQPARRGRRPTRTIVPHDILRMATFQSTRTSTLNIQPRIAGDLALMRGVAKYLFEAEKTDPEGNRPAVHRASHRGLRRLSVAGRVDPLGGDRASIRRPAGEDPRAGGGLSQVALGDHRLVPGRDPAGARRGHDPRDRQRPAAARQSSAGRGPGRARSAATPTCRATAPAGSTTDRPKRGSHDWTRPAASPRRGTTGSTPSASSRR